MSAYRAGLWFMLVSFLPMIAAFFWVFDGSPIEWDEGLALLFLAALVVVHHWVFVCPRCDRNILSSQGFLVIRGLQRHCHYCRLDLTAHRLRDRKFREG